MFPTDSQYFVVFKCLCLYIVLLLYLLLTKIFAGLVSSHIFFKTDYKNKQTELKGL